jgi:hypothetical protein
MTMALEHMEEDENTSRAIPKWVELEYNVGHVIVHDTDTHS